MNKRITIQILKYYYKACEFINMCDLWPGERYLVYASWLVVEATPTKNCNDRARQIIKEFDFGAEKVAAVYIDDIDCAFDSSFDRICFEYDRPEISALKADFQGIENTDAFKAVKKSVGYDLVSMDFKGFLKMKFPKARFKELTSPKLRKLQERRAR